MLANLHMYWQASMPTLQIKSWRGGLVCYEFQDKASDFSRF
jgi:hypothetical protein